MIRSGGDGSSARSGGGSSAPAAVLGLVAGQSLGRPLLKPRLTIGRLRDDTRTGWLAPLWRVKTRLKTPRKPEKF